MKRKIAIAMLSAAIACCSAVGLAACVTDSGDTGEPFWTIETAYAEAQDLGYGGTLEEFLAQIQGEDGKDGQDGVGIANVIINDDGDLIVTLSDGDEINCGSVRGEQGAPGVGITGAEIDSDGNLILYLSTGEPINCGKVVGSNGQDGTPGEPGQPGQPGEPGRGVHQVEINANGQLVITYTDGTSSTLDKVVGENGQDGTSIIAAQINSQGHLILTFNDEHTLDCGNVMGTDGVGIRDIAFNESGELIITMTDDNIINCGKIPVCVHQYSDWNTILEPTCTSIGYETRTCAICGNVEYNFFEKLDHTYGEWQDIIDTCTEHWQTRSCQICGDSQVREAEPAGHIFINGFCVVCGEVDVDSIDLTYLDQYNGTYGYEFLGTLTNGEALQTLYQTIDDEVKKFHVNTAIDAPDDYILADIDIGTLGLSTDQALSVWKTYKDDNPLYYWLSNTVTYSGESITLLIEEDYANGKVRSYYNQLIEDQVETYSSTLYEGANEYDIALAYHDAILTAVDYSYDESNQPEDSAWAHNIIGVFNGQGAVCEGYARTYQLLLNYSGIENVFVTGDGNDEDHAWNLVKMDDGNWYWCDLTWDDTFVGGLNTNWKWGISYNYFLVNDTQNTLIEEGGWEYGSEVAFLENHTYDTSTGSGIDFLYDLPERAEGTYSSDNIMLLDEISVDNMVLQVVGYNALELHEVTGDGNFIISDAVLYQNRTYKIISVGKDTGGMTVNGTITSFTVPETVIFIWDHAFGNYDIENIYVDENNPKFTSKDGVLFTKSLYTLILYPSANERTEYIIPDETYILAYWSFNNCQNLSKLTIGKNVNTIGMANWGGGYRDGEADSWFGGNVVSGGVERICNSLADNKQVIIHTENTSYQSDDFAIYNYGKTSILYVYDKDITTYHIPNTVTYIESTSTSSTVFSDCLLLESFSVDDDHPTFSVCDGVLYNKEKTYIIAIPSALPGEITIPEGVTSISENNYNGINFWGTNITKVNLPNSLRTIGSSAFNSCESLEYINIPNSVTSIGSSAFSGCSRLTSITIPENVTSIGSYAFSYCDSLESVIILGDIKNIEASTFDNCRALKTITIPDSVISIGEQAFLGCSSLENITIPDSIISIGSNAFYGCNSLQYNQYDNAYYLGNENNPYMVLVKAKDTAITSCIINDNTKIICGGSSFADLGFIYCNSLESITIPDSVISIGENVFYGCNSLQYTQYDNAYYLGNENNPYMVLVNAKDTAITSCIINENTKIICGMAFNNCDLLESIKLPDGLVSIGDTAFYNCYSLTNILIPGSVISVGEWAFWDCTQLTVYFTGTAEQWNEVYISNDINNSNGYLIDAKKYYYSEVEPTEEGNYWHYVDGVVTIW